MKVTEIRDLLGAQILTGEEQLSMEIQTACSSDMMSDVLAFPKEQMVLLTGLMNPQVMRTADMLDIRCVVLVRGKKPTNELVELARSYDVVMMTTQYSLYIASGILYSNGLHAHAKG